MGVARTELVTTRPSQEIKTLCEDDNNLSVSTMSAELVTEGKDLTQRQQICGHKLLFLHCIHGRCC